MTFQAFARHRKLLALGAAAIIAAPMVIGGSLSFDGARAAGIMQDPGQPLHSYADIVAADKPAVVTITTKMQVQGTSDDQGDGQQQFGQDFGPDSPYNQFFRQFFGDQSPFQNMRPQQPRGQVEEALGSGFIVSPDGFIVTNNHVIDGATQITVTLDDGKDYKGTLVDRDAKSDLAVVKIDAGKQLPTLSWGDSDKVRAGDPVLAIGNPFGIGTTVTSGIVSARGRDLHNGPYDDFLQVDAPINHGNSGGPLVGADGKVIGINTAIYSPNGGNVGVGFAIPSDQAEAVVAKLETGVAIEHGYIGVAIQPVTPDVADALGLKQGEGALIAQVVDGSPAADAGFKSGDVVTQFGGKAVTSPKDLSRFVADMAPGQNAQATVWRRGAQVTLNVAVGRNSDDKQASNAPSNTSPPAAARLSAPELGISLTDLSANVRARYGINTNVQGGLITAVDPSKSAADAGLQRGDVVVAVDQQETGSAKDVMAAVKSAEKDGRKSVLLQVQRGDDQMFVGVPLNNA